MKKVFLISFYLLTLFACTKEPIEVVDKGEKLTFEEKDFFCQIDTSQLDIYSFEDFLTKGEGKGTNFGDIKIISPDTSLISVSKAYINKIKDKPEINEKLVLYLNDTTVINTKINSVEDAGDRFNLGISIIPMEEVFNNLAVKAEVEEYYNQEADTKSSNNPNSFRSLIDEQGILHPAKSIYYDENNNPIVVDHRNPNANTKAGIKLGFDINTKIPIEKKDGNFKFSCVPKIHTWGGVGFSLKISWFKLKKFEAYAGAGIDIDLPISIAASGKKDFPIVDKIIFQKKCHKLFFIGIVPVVFNYAPGVRFKSGVSLSGEINLKTGISYSASAKVGTKWDNGTWIPIKENKSKFEFKQPVINVALAARLNAMIGPNIEYGFYGAYLGEVFAGGYAEIGLEAKIPITEKPKLNIGVGCEVGVQAGINFKLKILRWEVGKWEQIWKLYSIELFKKEWSIDLAGTNASQNAPLIFNPELNYTM